MQWTISHPQGQWNVSNIIPSYPYLRDYLLITWRVDRPIQVRVVFQNRYIVYTYTIRLLKQDLHVKTLLGNARKDKKALPSGNWDLGKKYSWLVPSWLGRIKVVHRNGQLDHKRVGSWEQGEQQEERIVGVVLACWIWQELKVVAARCCCCIGWRMRWQSRKKE